MTNPIQPVAWLREQRGEYEGPATLAPLLLLGHCEVTPHSKSHGATYEPLYGAAEIERLTSELAREKASRQTAQIHVEALQERINRAGVEKDLEVARLRGALRLTGDFIFRAKVNPNYLSNAEDCIKVALRAKPDDSATGG